MARCPRTAPEGEGCPERTVRDLRRELENTPMCRHSNPIPVPVSQPGCGCGGGCACGSGDSAAVLAALERQNALLAELLAAVTGLTAACLCRNREE